MENAAAETQRRNEEELCPNRRRPALKWFLLCLLASALCTAAGIAAMAAMVPEKSAPIAAEPQRLGMERGERGEFRFLRRLGVAEPHIYPGGEIRWARFSPDAGDDDESPESNAGGISAAILRLRGRALRAPRWNINANEHGYVIQGRAWAGLLTPDHPQAVVFPLAPGQAVFFPRNSLHWLRNAGADDLVLLLFFSTRRPLLSLDVDDVFFNTPEDVIARALKPQGGADFIRTFRKPALDQALNLPDDLELSNSSVAPSPPELVWKFFYDLPASRPFPFPGGIFRWARFRHNGSGLSEHERIYSEELRQHQGALTLATLRIFSGALGAPHFHSNADEMAAVLRGCGLVGLVTPEGESRFTVGVGDVVFFPTGSQHFIQSFCQDDLLLVLAYSTNTELETLRMNQYFHAIPRHVLAQLFHKEQEEFEKFPKNS